MTDTDIDELFDDANGDLALGELAAAIGKYQRCVELQPDFFDGWHALAMARMKNDDIAGAIIAGKQAVKLQPNDQLAWSSLSLFFVRNHQIKEAEAAGAKAKVLSWGGKLDADAVVAEMEAWSTTPGEPPAASDKQAQ